MLHPLDLNSTRRDFYIETHQSESKSECTRTFFISVLDFNLSPPVGKEITVTGHSMKSTLFYIKHVGNWNFGSETYSRGDHEIEFGRM